MKQVMRNDVPQGVTTYAPVPQVEQTAREETQASFDYDLSEPLIQESSKVETAYTLME